MLLVEDVVDTGLTLHFLCRTLALRDPASLAAVTLLDRPYRRLVDEIPLRYVGFTVPDELFAGYGLGLDERWRALPGPPPRRARSRCRAPRPKRRSVSDGSEVEQRVDGHAVDAHLEVEVRAGRVPRRADERDGLALAHRLPDATRGSRKRARRRGEPVPVVDHDEVPVSAEPARRR